MKKENIYAKACPFLQSIIASNKNDSIPVIVSLKSQKAYTQCNVSALSTGI